MLQEFNRVLAEQEIREAIVCPADWATVFRVEGPAIFEPLQGLWQAILEENVRGDEAESLGPDYWLDGLLKEPDGELRAMQLNVRLWKDAARDRFLTAARRFTDLRFASRQDYGKHFPPPGPWRGARWIEEESIRRGISIFYFDIPEEAALIAFLHGIFWSFSAYEGDLGVDPATAKLWEKLLKDNNSRVCFRCSGSIGASGGVSTQFICFELDATTPIVHGYPVPEIDALRTQNGCPIQTITELEQWELH